MKFIMKVTPEIMERAAMCGYQPGLITTNCAFALAYNELVPRVEVDGSDIIFYKKYCPLVVRAASYKSLQSGKTIHYDTVGFSGDDILCYIPMTEQQKGFIMRFDGMDPGQRRAFLETLEFEVEIPDEVIEYWYGHVSKAAEKIANSPVLSIVE